MFCMAPMKPDVMEPSSNDDFITSVGLGMVRACRGHEDGTSHLVLQGIARVRLTGFIQEDPFRMAELRELLSEAGRACRSGADHHETAKDLRSSLPAGILRFFKSDVDQQLAKIHDPELLSDIIAHTFLRDPEQRQEVFEESWTSARIALLARYLEA